MRKAKNPRRIIKIGLLVALIAILILMLQTSGFRNFADIAYPPIPQSHYALIDDAVEFCKVPKSMRGYIAAMAYAESTFNEEAESYAGAVGVMQVLIPTGYGMAVKYNIPGVTADTYKKAKQGYLMGTCYTRYVYEQIADTTELDKWNDEKVRMAIAIAYNAGTGRGKSYYAGAYNGPASSVGYAGKIERARPYYNLLFAQYDQRVAAGEEAPTTDIKAFIWGLILGRKLE